jgi:steroid 5-alpha reductase family enzyme
MDRSKSILGILMSLVIASLILLAGSFESITWSGWPLFVMCGAIGFILHWIVFVPSYLFQTEHYFDLTGSLSYIATVVAAVLLNPSFDIRDLIICAMIIIWAGRLGSFLFFRIKKDGQDSRFVVMKTKFTWFLMTWTIGGLWVLVTMAAGLAALTSNTTVELGLMCYVGIALWICCRSHC